MFGIINLDKPRGLSSRRAVDRVARLVRPAKAGHAGTLDPLASGVLVVCVGPATRLIEFVQQMPKRYRATFLLGRESPTEDLEGDVTLLENPPVPTREQLQQAAANFVGEIRQRPPAFSALKIDGQRAYKLARRGAAVELQPRTIVVHEIEIVAYEYPELTLDIRCGSGTYVRSLGRDLAHAVGTAAVMSNLVRTAVGSFTIEHAISPDALSPETLTEHLLPAVQAVEHLPRVELSPGEIVHIVSGRTIEWTIDHGEGQQIAAVDRSGQLVALLAPVGENQWRAARNFAPPA